MSRRRALFQTAVLETTWGSLSVDADNRGVLACHLPDIPPTSVPLRILSSRFPADTVPVLREAIDFVRALLEGRDPGPCPALHPSFSQGAPPFHRIVWDTLLQISRGQTITYGQVARQAGASNAARAVGTACGANPLPLFIPCHRVVAAGGRLGGFSPGVAWKIHLLSSEGVDL